MYDRVMKKAGAAKKHSFGGAASLMFLSVFIVGCEKEALSRTLPDPDRPEPVARVVLNNEVFEFWPYSCRSMPDGSPKIEGVRQNPDGSPVQEQVPLLITGKMESNPAIGVVPYNQLYFRFQGHDIYLVLEGEDHTLIDEDQRFTWEGATEDGASLLIEVVCPWSG